MLSKIYNFWQILKGNLWFIPAMFCLFSFGFTLALYALEIKYFQEYEFSKFFFQGSTNNAKSVAVTLLSAMITMATLAISITIVVLSLAASQLGPRLIKTFMSDRKTKDFIGMFFATVIACFVLTIILHARTSEAITPQLTISMVLLTCFVNLFVLLGFVNHVAQSCIADNVALKVKAELDNALDRLTCEAIGPYDSNEQNTKENWPDNFKQNSTHLYFENAGYVQNIDYDQLLDIAEQHNLKIEIEFKAGHFLVKGENGLYVQSKDEWDEETEKKIMNSFIIGNARTATQDIEYSIRHLVEIAIRALSPGINDSFTAMNVADHLSAALAVLMENETPTESFFDESGEKRVHAKQSSEADLIFTAFDQIRFNGSSMPSLIRHLLEKFTALVDLARDRAEKDALAEQIHGLSTDLALIKKYVPDRADLEDRIKALKQKLEG